MTTAAAGGVTITPTSRHDPRGTRAFCRHRIGAGCPSRSNRSASPGSEGRVLTDVIAAYDANERDLFTFALGVTRDGAAAEDIVQEAFLRLVRESRAGRHPDNARAWLYRVVVNLARTRARRRAVADRWRGLFANRDVVRSPEDDIVGREGAAILAALVASLPTDARMAFLLATDGHSGQEVAALMGRSEGATRNLLWRARRELRGRMEQRGGRMSEHAPIPGRRRAGARLRHPAADERRLEAHLRECAECRRFAAGLRADEELARSLPRTHAPDRVRQAVVTAVVQPATAPGFARFLPVAGAAVIALMLLAGLGLVAGLRTQPAALPVRTWTPLG